jgi:hypothetical protein
MVKTTYPYDDHDVAGNFSELYNRWQLRCDCGWTSEAMAGDETRVIEAHFDDVRRLVGD